MKIEQCKTCKWYRFCDKFREAECTWEPKEESVTNPEVCTSEESVDEVFTSERFAEFIKQLSIDEYNLWHRKNKDYADHEGDDQGNTFENFDNIASELGLTSEMVVWVYLSKQLRALQRYVRYGKLESEPLKSRIMDARIFLAILGGIAKRKGDL